MALPLVMSSLPADHVVKLLQLLSINVFPPMACRLQLHSYMLPWNLPACNMRPLLPWVPLPVIASEYQHLRVNTWVMDSGAIAEPRSISATTGKPLQYGMQ
jgi:hypothetical protein